MKLSIDSQSSIIVWKIDHSFQKGTKFGLKLHSKCIEALSGWPFVPLAAGPIFSVFRNSSTSSGVNHAPDVTKI